MIRFYQKEELVLTIGERIRYLRKECLKIKSAEYFGKKIGISGSNVGNIETGRVNATDRVISDICTVFDVNENWLRHGEPNEIFIELSESEEIAKYVQSLLDSSNDVIVDMIKNFIVIYQKLDDNSKDILKNVANELLDKTKNEQA